MHFSAAVCLAAVCALCAPLASAFPNGAPQSSCDTLSPAIGGHLVEASDCPNPCPFEIQLIGTSNVYSCGGTVSLQLVSTDQTTFRGFFIQARETTGVFTSEAPFVGQFVNPQDDWQIRPCSGSDAGATHVSRNDKVTVDLLQWQAPQPGEPAPSVTFWFSIVQVRTNYHVRMLGLTLVPDEQSCQGMQARFVENELSTPEEITPLLVCVELLTPVEELVSFVVAMVPGQNTATEDEDYVITVPAVSFQGGSGPGTTQCAEISIVDDELVEEDETISLGLLTSTDRSVVDEATVTIVDNDEQQPMTRLEFVDDSITTVESGGPELSVCAIILDSSPTDIIVASLQFADDTATEGEDYVISQGTISFFPGAAVGSTACFTVDIIDDQQVEPDETFQLFLTRENEILDELPVTILGDAPAPDPPTVGFLNPVYSVSEGITFAACVAIFSGGANEPFSLQMVSFSGSAIVGMGGDAEQVLTAVEFEGVSVEGDSQCVDVTIFQDFDMEPIEFFFLGLFPISGQTVPLTIDPQRMFSTVNIIDIPPQGVSVGFTETVQSVNEDVGPLLSCIQIITDSPLTQDVTVTIQSADGSAVSSPVGQDPPDYLAINPTITIMSGTANGTTFCVSVTVVDDEVLENQEKFFLNLELPSQQMVTVADGTQTVYIIDNEPPVSEFLLMRTEIETREGDVPIEDVCLEMVSDGPLLQDAFFDITAQNRTAIEFEDFVVPAVLQFPAGSRRGDTSCFGIVIIDDDVAEGPEEFTVDISSTDPNLAVIQGGSTVTVSVEDDDVLYVGLFPPAIEVNEVDREVFVCVRVYESGPVLQDRRVRIGTQDGSAVAMEDYVMQNTELIFPPGTVVGDVQCLGIPIIDNNRADGTRNFFVSLVAFDPLVRVQPIYSIKLVFIVDNDGSQVEFQPDNYQVMEGVEDVEVCVALLGLTLNETGFVSVSTQDGTATAGNDYVGGTQTIEIPSGSISGSTFCVSITILNDGIAETDQLFTVLLTSLTPSVFSIADGGGEATVTIIDDEETGLPVVTFSELEQNVLEGAEEPALACIILSDESLSGQPASFDITSSPGSATAGIDYTPVSASLTLPANTPVGTLSCVSLNIIDDQEMEQREYFSLRLMNLSPGIVTVNEGGEVQTVRILDDDSPMAVVGFQVIESTVNESVANKFTCIEIISGGPLMFDSQIRFYTQDGTAVAPDDYTAVDMILTFRQGADGSRPSDAVCVEVPIIDDIDAEERERLTFRIEAVDQDRIRVDESLAEKVLYIEDNDAVFVGFERSAYLVPEDLGLSLGLLVCVTVEDVAFPFQLITEAEDGSATEILDYQVNNSPLQFFLAGGNQTQCAYVQVIDDDIPEPIEYFTLQLSSNEPRVVVTTPSALIRILDNDEQ